MGCSQANCKMLHSEEAWIETRMRERSLFLCQYTCLTRKVFGFEQTYMYEILVAGPLCTSECARECRLSANLCKRALDVTADVIVEATRNADILTINANAL